MTNRLNARPVRPVEAAAGSSANERQTSHGDSHGHGVSQPAHDSVEAALAVLTAHEQHAGADTMGARALPSFDEGDIDALLDELFAHELDVDWDKARAQHVTGPVSGPVQVQFAFEGKAQAQADGSADAGAETPPGLSRPRSGRSAA